MNIRQQLGNYGIFTRIPLGLSGHNREEAVVWRAVIDQTLRDVLTKSEKPSEIQACQDAFEWINSAPGTLKTIHDEDYDGNPCDFVVDLHEEFEEVCRLSNLSPDFVRTTWHRLYRRMKK